MQLIREWSPNGYDRAVELFERHFYDNSHFFRAVPNFLVQFGISYSEDKELQKLSKKRIKDDPKHDPPIEFHPGIISYAGSGENSRTSQLFISYGSAKSLGTQVWETPIGKVIEGLENAKQFYSYGDMPPWGKGPVQGKIYGGPKYIEEGFPLIDKFLECTVTRSGASEIVPEDVDDDKSQSKSAEDKSKAEDSSEDIDDTILGETHDDPMHGSKAPSDLAKHSVKKGGLRSVGSNGKFYAVPQAVRDKLLQSKELGDSLNTDSYAVPVAVIFLMVVLSVLLRGRRKESSKEN